MRLIPDPFRVTEEQIEVARPDVEIRLLGDRHFLSLTLGPFNRAKELLNSITFCAPVAHKQYWLRPLHLPSVLKALRDHHLSFAVEAKCSDAMTAGKALRQELSQKKYGSLHEISAALITPYLTVSNNSELQLIGALPFEENELVSWKSTDRERRAAIKKLTVTQARLVAWNAQCSGTKLWLTDEAVDLLSGSIEAEQLDEESLVVTPITNCWCVDGTNNPVLLIIGDDTPPSLSAYPFMPFTSLRHLRKNNPTSDGKLFIIPPEKLWSEVNAFADSPQADESQRFIILKEKFSQGLEDRIEAQAFHALRDCSGDLENTDLEKRLFPHQRVAVRWILRRPATLVGDDMGLGKTLSVLAATDELFTREEIDKAIIICPNSLLGNWERESKQWIPSRSCLILPKGKTKRQATLDEFRRSDSPTILVTNYEAVRIEDVAESLLEIAEDSRILLCLDESQRVKNSQSKTFDIVGRLAPFCTRKILLSGTPTPKDISDIWAQMFILDQGDRFGRDYFRWLGSVAELGTDYSAVAVKRFIPHQVEFTITRVKEVLLRRKKEDVLDLPPKMFVQRDVEMTGSQEKRFQEICDELRVQLSTDKGKSYTRDITNILEQYLRAVQIASNPRLIDPNWQGTPAKFLELDLLLEELIDGQNQQVVLWTNYLKNTHELAERYKKWGTAVLSGEVKPKIREAAIKEFQSATSKIKIMIAIPAAAGVGLTLTRAQTAIYIDKTWNAEHWLQSVDRIHRIGQTGTVTIVSLHASKVDVLISNNLKRKSREQEKLLSGGDSGHFPSREELLAALGKKRSR